MKVGCPTTTNKTNNEMASPYRLIDCSIVCYIYCHVCCLCLLLLGAQIALSMCYNHPIVFYIDDSHKMVGEVFYLNTFILLSISKSISKSVHTTADAVVQW